MATNSHKKRIRITCAFMALVFPASSVLGFPQDNAAVLYLRAFIIFETPSRDLSRMLDDLRDGKIEPNRQIRQYFEKNRPVIDLVTTASEMPDCDWGRDLSKGVELMMPELSIVRKMAFMLIADSKIFLHDGDYKKSLERCLTVHRMARHVGDDLIISNLVGIAMNGLANKHIKIVLSEMPADIETLEWLKGQMSDVSAKRLSLISAVVNEAEVFVGDMRKEKIDEILNMPGAEEALKRFPKELIENIRNGDEAFFEESRRYYMDFIAAIQTAMDMPYEGSQKELAQLLEKISEESQKNPAAILTATMTPHITKLCANEIRNNTSLNATNAAVDIYIVRAKTGQLPDELPAGLPKDLYSGKDFEYEKTQKGFVLRCRARDLNSDRIHEYEFKIKE